jgi:hypothetical protein
MRFEVCTKDKIEETVMRSDDRKEIIQLSIWRSPVNKAVFHIQRIPPLIQLKACFDGQRRKKLRQVDVQGPDKVSC